MTVDVTDSIPIIFPCFISKSGFWHQMENLRIQRNNFDSWIMTFTLLELTVTRCTMPFHRLFLLTASLVTNLRYFSDCPREAPFHHDLLLVPDAWQQAHLQEVCQGNWEPQGGDGDRERAGGRGLHPVWARAWSVQRRGKLRLPLSLGHHGQRGQPRSRLPRACQEVRGLRQQQQQQHHGVRDAATLAQRQ